MRPCVFCGSTTGEPTDEHVIPKWARKAFDIQGPVTLHSRDRHISTDKKLVGRMQHLNLVLRGEICACCNNGWLSGLERAVQPILQPMVVSARPTALDAPAQALIAAWAVKTVLLLERAIRQKYPQRRLIEGYEATSQEFAWLQTHSEPPPRSMVWLGCWDCKQETPAMYEPSGAVLPTRDGYELAGHLTTFAIGFVAFQVFTVDFLAAELHGAYVWNTHVPVSLAGSLERIWPPQLLVSDVSWPPQAFANGDWGRLVTWDGRLRPARPTGAEP
jgi:hypothetical protein